MLAGCSNAPPRVVATTSSELTCPPQTAPLPYPSPIQQVGVTWEVLTQDRLPTEPSWARVTLTPRQYENLARNYAEITRWVTEARGQLEYYRGEGPDEPAAPSR